MLRFSYGNLVLYDESQIPIWSTNLNTTNISSSIEAVLLDEGNLVLRDLSNDFLWQSIDNPTHAWLPGMKIGFNKRTKEKKRLTSQKNIADPAPGLYSLELDPDGTDQYVMMWNENEIFWRSGIWSGQMYSLVPEMAYFINNDMYNVSFISDENKQSFVYFVNDPNFISRLILDASGQVRQMYWLENTSKSWFQIWSTPRQPCEIYAYCGAFGSCCTEQTQHFCGCLQGFKPTLEHNWNFLEDYTSGCVRKIQLQCENNSLANGKSDRFLANPDVTLPGHAQSVAVGNIMECKTTCLNDCSCIAYAYEDNTCSIWNRNLMTLQQLAKGDQNGKTIYVKLAASEFSNPKSNKKVAKK
ncbi:hypothetical protein LWI29_017622 [Acer saccharum]|uniref:Uncharacterized protein n=1 Tax=Acer saccharum TaxID=4024 RepID=A0AA39VT67_ACESA|nr:hypothetical protein LWI29_017622 [Acer saccharum]